MKLAKRFLSVFLAAAIVFTGSTQTVQAAMISAAQVSESTITSAGAQDRATIIAALSREDVQSALVARGIDVKEAESRVAALSDEEASTMASHIDTAPAGGIIGAIVLIFLVLLLTDILGFTKIFPFTRSLK